jgi:hypothetical protein
MEEKKDQLIQTILWQILTKGLEGVSLPPELTATQFIEHFSAESLPRSFLTSFGKVTIEIPVADLIKKIVNEMNERLDSLPMIFKDGEIELQFEESEGLKAGLDWFAEVAAVYFLSNLQKKTASMLNLFFEQSLSMALKVGQARFAKQLGDRENRTPIDIDMRPLLNSFYEQGAAEDKERNARWLDGFKGLKIVSQKGRPRTWTKDSLHQAIRKASFQIRKERYRAPKLVEVAKVLNKRHPGKMSLNAKSLGQMLKRYEIDWKEIKKPHN